MTPQDIEKLLVELSDKQAIQDCLSRYSRAVDRLDRELLLSVYHPDAIDDHGTFCGGPEEFADYVIAMHGSTHLNHQHCIFNHYCDLDGDTAHTEAYFMFVGINRKGPPITMSGGRYLDRFEKRGGEWKVAHRLCIRDWAWVAERPDPANQASMSARAASLPPEIIAFLNSGPTPSRDRTDPSYLRPLGISPERLAQGRELQSVHRFEKPGA